MKKNHKEDWTSVLQERLKDARLPLEDGWAAGVVPETPGNPVQPTPETGGRTGKGGFSGTTPAWWPWALAGVAAVLAAVLLLRPVREPAPSLLTQNQPATVPAPSSNTARFEDKTGNNTLPSSKMASGEESRPQTPASSSNTARFEDKAGKNTPLSSKQAQNEDTTPVSGIQDPAGEGEPGKEIPGQAGNDGQAGSNGQDRNDGQDLRNGEAGSLAEIAQNDLPAEPEAPRKPRRGPVSLRLQASVGGLGGPGGASRMAMANTNTDAFVSSSSSAQDAYHGEYIVMNAAVSSGTGTQPQYYDAQNGINTAQQYYLDQAASQQARPFPISIGVSAALPLSRSWTLTAGLDYTQRSGTRAVTRTQASNGFTYNEMSVDNVLLHYLGLPVDVHFYFNPDRRLRFYLGAGLKAEKCIYVKGAAPLADPILLSGSLQAGADFRLVPGVRLYLAPSVVQYFNQSSYYAFWDDRPSFVLRAGLAFDLKQK